MLIHPPSPFSISFGLWRPEHQGYPGDLVCVLSQYKLCIQNLNQGHFGPLCSSLLRREKQTGSCHSFKTWLYILSDFIIAVYLHLQLTTSSPIFLHAVSTLRLFTGYIFALKSFNKTIFKKCLHFFSYYQSWLSCSPQVLKSLKLPPTQLSHC